MAAADDPSEKQSESESKQFSEAARSLPLPPPVLHHLLSTGVCPRCMFRLFGVRGSVYSLSSLTASMFSSLINASLENENDGLCCNVCLGILEFGSCGIDGFVKSVGQVIEKEGHQIDGFCLEISVPPVIYANERAFWIDMKNKYGSAEWFKDKYIWEQITVKEALRLSITSSLESHLDVKSAINTFSLRFTYSHLESSAELQQSFGNDHGSKRRKTGAEAKDALIDSNGRRKGDSNGQLHTESDAAILRVINNLQDDAFHEKFVLPHQKVFKPCHLEITCQKMPMYIAGRYLKFSRKVSQSRWIIDDERMGEASVEEIVGSNALSVCKGDSYKFHAAGREDIDVRMLGSGRPFLIEVLNARRLPAVVDIQLIEDTINREYKQYVRVRKLKLVGTEIWNLMREGEAEKQKRYAAVVWISNPLTEENSSYISSLKDMLMGLEILKAFSNITKEKEISQKTPIRVLHRRSPLERKRVIHWMKVEKIQDSSQYFLLHLCTQAGTYIKEFVHGDLGRTHPSIGSILGCRAEILQLDVTDVKMDSFD